MPAEASVLGGGMTLTDTVKGAASLTARFALYPSILYNLARNRLQDNWHWWDKITEHVILGALPFASMLETFQDKGVRAVVTLNEDFEVFISSEQYKEIGISHLHIPTVDYLYAPPVKDLHRGVQFIAEQAVQGEVTYVHCKAGRGRSTTLVICYLIREMRMCPQEAYAFVRQKRPQVCLADGQWNAVRQFHSSCLEALAADPKAFPATSDRLAVDEEAGTPLNDLSRSSVSEEADADSTVESATATAEVPQASSTAEDLSPAAARSAEREAAACSNVHAAALSEARICSEAAAAVAAATETRLRGALDRTSAQLLPVENGQNGCTDSAGPVVADTCAQGSERIPICTGQHASAASLALSEPVLVAASDADSTRSVMTAAGAASVDCGRIAAGQFPASGSAGSLSRGSLSMVLCEDFGTALCDAGDLEDAALPPADSQAAAAATAASDSGCRPEEGASKRRRSAEAQGDEADEVELARADSSLQRIQDWASVCRDGTLENVER